MQFDPQAMKQLYEIIKSPAGQQLISMLQQKGGKDLETALILARKGDYQEAQTLLATILKDSDANSLLKQLGG